MNTVSTQKPAAFKAWMALPLLLLCHLVATPASAQVRVGLKGGFQLANMEWRGSALGSSNRVGFFAGPTAKFTLPVVGLGIDAAILFDQRDLKVEESTFKQQSLVLQGSARYDVGIGDVIGIFAHIGPQFSFNVGDDLINWVTKEGGLKQFSLQETMLSVNMGVGVTLFGHLEGRISYNIPVSKTADFTWSNLGTQLGEQSWSHAKSRTNAWSIAATYYF